MVSLPVASRQWCIGALVHWWGGGSSNPADASPVCGISTFPSIDAFLDPGREDAPVLNAQHSRCVNTLQAEGPAPSPWGSYPRAAAQQQEGQANVRELQDSTRAMHT
jgi:hypothetical protein